ncbi:MAG: hypothetical protein ACODTU_16545 [Pigmentiphaga sp.]|uniref:hypothetical protein n=1 Tax=Pigmentiphaga sp. TaxID=1977564 RepID=UPI003B5818D2
MTPPNGAAGSDTSPRMLSGVSEAGLTRTGHRGGCGQAAGGDAEHRRIVQALKHRDADTARREIFEHIVHARTNLLGRI